VIIGIVGSEAAKFCPETEKRAKELIWDLLSRPNEAGDNTVTGVSSGHCHLGGIDIWAEEIGAQLGLTAYIFPPKTPKWETGYKPRNLQIVAASDEVHCITVKTLPPEYSGMQFPYCYHCKNSTHIKSGGCWTMKQAIKAGKVGVLHII